MRTLSWPRTAAIGGPALGGKTLAPDRPAPQSGVRLVLGVAAFAYLVGVSLYLVASGGWPTPDFLIPPLLLIAVAAGRGWTFLIDWLPFLVLVLVYEGFRGIADDINGHVHYGSLIRADEWFFGAGHTGPNVLQAHLARPGSVTWYDWAASFLYSAHYVAPVILGFVLWLKSRALYWRFVVSLLVLFFAGFITFYLYPAAPPWLAADNGLIPPIERVLVHTFSTLPATQPFALAYQRFSPNEVAAMPSLHAASPMLIALVSLSVWGKKALLLLAYPIVGGLAWVYLGEHYLIDVLAGGLYGLTAFTLVWSLGVPGLIWVSRLFLRNSRRPVGPRFRPLPAWPLAIAAFAFIAYVWVDPLFRVPLRPPASESSPLFAVASPELTEAMTPALSVPDDFFVAPCYEGLSFASMADALLQPLALQYGAYVVGLDSDECFTLAAEAVLAPPDSADLGLLALDFEGSPNQLTLTDDSSGLITVASFGAPSETFQKMVGAVPGQRYVLVVRTDNFTDKDELQQVAAAITEIIFDR